MTKLGTQHSGNGFDPFAAFQPMTMFGGAQSDAFAHARETWTKACLAWQEEIVRATTAQFQRGSQAAQAMTACKTLEDVVKLQQEWVASTVRACMEDAGRFTQLASKLAPGLSPIGEPSAPAQVHPAPTAHPAHVASEHHRRSA